MMGMVHNLQTVKQRIIASVFAKTDFAQIAKAFGCNGVKVTDPGVLGDTIKNSLPPALPTVIDVATDPNESFFKIAQSDNVYSIMRPLIILILYLSLLGH
jgi:thiamine pyrophosphate-dependent acetolactate synthase large subunit-like protein